MLSQVTGWQKAAHLRNTNTNMCMNTNTNTNTSRNTNTNTNYGNDVYQCRLR